MATLRLVLGDQLFTNISSLRDIDTHNDLVVMMEVRPETDYVAHHKRKIAFLFSAMRHFAKSLSQSAKVKYFTLDSPNNQQDFIANLKLLLNQKSFSKIVATEPAEYRLLKQLEEELPKLNVSFEIREDDRFLCSKSEFESFANQQKSLKMENFYRWMRKKYGLLMTESGKPVGGKWNYDHDNRSPFKAECEIKPRLKFMPDKITNDVLKLVEDYFPDNFGSLEDFNEPVTETQALESFHYFLDNYLVNFGKFQDAMVKEESFMFHSRISHLINCGLLDPLSVCKVISQKIDVAPLSAIEGFIRQIIGWREYVRGIYWLNMPEYIERNFFSHTRNLPDFYWTGNCKMNCIKSVVDSTRKTVDILEKDVILFTNFMKSFIDD